MDILKIYLPQEASFPLNFEILFYLISDSQSADDSEANPPTSENGVDLEVKEDEFDWCIEQTPYVEQPLLIGAPRYGFANQKSGVFERLQVHFGVPCASSCVTSIMRLTHRNHFPIMSVLFICLSITFIAC